MESPIEIKNLALYKNAFRLYAKNSHQHFYDTSLKNHKPSLSRSIYTSLIWVSVCLVTVQLKFKMGIMGVKSKILVIGGTGYIGRHMVEASAKAGHPTYVLVRESTLSNPSKSELLAHFKNLGVTFLIGDLFDHESLVNAIKQVDVLISAVGHAQLEDQDKIVDAIKEAGNIKRFFPSEFGSDPDWNNAVEPVKATFTTKIKIRRSVEAAGIPYTYVVSNFFAGKFLRNLTQIGAASPPRDKVVILGDGNPLVIFTKEEDIGTFTIKAVDDPRTLNKSVFIKCPDNTYSLNDLVSLWESKIGKTLHRVYVPEEQVLKNIQVSPIPLNAILAICHSVFIKGDHTNFKIDPTFGFVASDLYPEVKYTSVSEYLGQLV